MSASTRISMASGAAGSAARIASIPAMTKGEPILVRLTANPIWSTRVFDDTGVTICVAPR